MNWLNVKLIFFREIRDQLRDRRTLFMIGVLPVLLYPLLGMSILQVRQFMQEKPCSVLIVGAGELAGLPPLVENGRFAARLFYDADQMPPDPPEATGLLEVHFAPDEARPGAAGPSEAKTQARLAVEQGQYDAAIYFPPDFGRRLKAIRQASRRPTDRPEPGQPAHTPVDPDDKKLLSEGPEAEIICSTAIEKSQIAFARVFRVLQRWGQEIHRKELVAAGMPTAKPFDVKTADVAEETGRRGAAVWSKVLPILLVVWAMTGAFYPAVDLCAGEKERGTLETLLCSPAERSEIVLGKLLTIMLFSMATALWNLLSMGVTGWLILAQVPHFGPPPLMAAVWLAIALIPVAALFGALCLALAALARSTKEGQYYLMPLLLITMPLVVLPMAPGVELNLGNSLIPVTGVVLLLRGMMEGSFWQAWPLAFPVAGVTLACCLLSIRWAVDQFNSESVLFREGERLDPGLWLRNLLANRQPTPTAAAAFFCGAMILMVRFFVGFHVRQPEGFGGLAVLVLVTQLAVIAAPTLLMTTVLTTSPRQTLLLRRPRWMPLLAAAALALVLHPLADALRAGVLRLYPISPAMERALSGIFDDVPGFWHLVLVMAVLPAICEELAFRGFILSGFRHLGRKWRAIVYSAVFFALSHTIFQQQLVAGVMGLVIGYVAVQTGSILPCIVFHVLHNTLGLAMGQISEQITPALLDRWPLLGYLVSPAEGGGMLFGWPVLVLSALLSLELLLWLHRLPYRKSRLEEEEGQREALRRVSEDEDAAEGP